MRLPRRVSAPSKRSLAGCGDRQAAAAEIEVAQLLEAGHRAARRELQAPLLEHVQADQTQIAHVLLHQVGDVIVAHEQHVERQVLAEARPAGPCRARA